VSTEIHFWPHEMQGISLGGQKLLACQEGLNFVINYM
jgi:hypothetical protein